MLTEGESMVILSFAEPADCVPFLLVLRESARGDPALGEKVTNHPKTRNEPADGRRTARLGRRRRGAPCGPGLSQTPPRVARVGTSYPPSQPRQKSRVKIGNLTQIV